MSYKWAHFHYTCNSSRTTFNKYFCFVSIVWLSRPMKTLTTSQILRPFFFFFKYFDFWGPISTFFKLWPRSIPRCKKKRYYMYTDGLHFYTWELVLLFHKDVSTINHLVARQHLTYLLISYAWEVVDYKYGTDLFLGNLISYIIHRIIHPNCKHAQCAMWNVH